ncbi:Fumarate hydratase class II [bioreactor metagenome]|uniref:Fumarate hydratase class II n=1 Tax=bioreactor metagenome TaxID=1076179 RepID=A0A645IV29_9ZZZZ
MGGASGNFELNVCKPLIAHNVLQSIRLLGDAMCSFERYCVCGIAANRVQIDAHVERSLMLVTALVPHIGYDLAASIARTAHVEGKTLRDAALASGAITAADFDRWVRPASMIGMGARSTDCGEGQAGER